MNTACEACNFDARYAGMSVIPAIMIMHTCQRGNPQRPGGNNVICDVCQISSSQLGGNWSRYTAGDLDVCPNCPTTRFPEVKEWEIVNR